MDPAALQTLLQSVAPASPGTDMAKLLPLFQFVMKELDDNDSENEAELALRRRRAWRRLTRVRRLLEQMTQRNAFVAGALGACECWGADVTCEHCGGRGSPGCFEPIPDAFGALVVPLLRRRGSMLRDFVARPPNGDGTLGATAH